MTSSPLLRRWQRRVAVLAPPLMVAAFVVMLLDSLDRRRESALQVEHSYRVIGHLADLRARVVDAETGQRGYVITGDTAYLEPYRNARGDARALLARLHLETRGDAVQRRSLDALTPLVSRRLDILEGRVVIRRTQGFDRAREALITGGGKAAMDQIRAVLAAMQHHERRLLALREAAEEGRGRTVLWVLFAGAVLVIGVAAMTGALFGRDAKRQAALNAELLVANGRLQDQALELEVQAEELQAQASQLEAAMVELEASNDELEAQRGHLEEMTVDLADANHRLHALNETLEARTAEAEAANRAKTEFLTNMSHELRTPLNAIAGYADLMELGVHGALNDAQHAALARIRYNERHLLALINDVLNFAKLGAGRIELRITDVPVGALLEETAGVMEPLVRAKGLSCAAEAAEPWVRVRGDHDRIAQILLNLLSNAVKCTAPGGSLRIWAEPEGESVAIHVQDTGCGIDPEQHETIFDPFVQLTPEGALSQGVGLGLSISRELARAMQGELTVRSAPGEGATFTLTLPHGRRIPAQKIVEPPTWSSTAQEEPQAG
ncbi:MAG TPA: CHASE3 domain-containing protein [Longimicrobium sp.]|jgi:signal transduction histidine kinase|nr:CHASE3 domain-containing protein [Longimicrobium sp.]